jgi:hypothetical protein
MNKTLGRLLLYGVELFASQKALLFVTAIFFIDRGHYKRQTRIVIDAANVYLPPS